MKRLFAFVILLLAVTFAHAQKGKVVTASTLLSQGSIADAKDAIDQAFSDPEVETMAKAWLTKAQVYLDIYKFQISEELKAHNAVAVAHEAYVKAYELDMAAEKKPGRYLDEIQAGMYSVAIGHFEDAADKFNKNDYTASMEAFQSCYNTVEWLEAKGLTVAESAEDYKMLKGDALTNAALCALNLTEYDKAAGFYEKMIDMGVADDRVYANLSSIYIVQGEFEKAKPVIDAGRAAYPDNESLVESELNYFIGTDQSEKAIDKLLAAIELNDSDPDIFFNLALAYDKLGEKEKMIETYEKIIEMDPQYEGAYLNLGAYYNERANDIIKAMNELTDWKEAIKMEPDRDKYYNLALPYLEKAYELMPDEEGVKRALERIYANMNMLDKIKELKAK